MNCALSQPVQLQLVPLLAVLVVRPTVEVQRDLHGWPEEETVNVGEEETWICVDVVNESNALEDLWTVFVVAANSVEEATCDDHHSDPCNMERATCCYSMDALGEVTRVEETKVDVEEMTCAAVKEPYS